MKKISVVALMMAIVMPLAQADGSHETVKQWNVDTKGKPPYRRSVEHIPVTEIAQLEQERYETVTVWHVDMGGKPPYKRSFKNMRVTDVAQLEIEDKSTIDYSSKPPFKRHK